MAIKDRNAVLDELEALQGEYDSLYEQVDVLYTDINTAHDEAYELINSSAELISSIKHCPIPVITKLKKIRGEKEKVVSKSELRKEERKKDLEAGAASVAALGVGAIVATSFKDFLSSFAKKLGKNGGWILVILFIIILFVVFLISKAVNRGATIRKANKAIKTLTKQIADLKNHQHAGQQHLAKLNAQGNVVFTLCQQLQCYYDCKYSDVEKEDRPLLGQLVNDTYALVGIIGEEY